MDLSIGFHKKFKYVKSDKNMHNPVVFLWNMTSFAPKNGILPIRYQKSVAKSPTGQRVFDDAGCA